LTVVLFSLLVSAGFGSLWTGRLVQRGPAVRWLRPVLLMVVLLAVVTTASGVGAARMLEGASAWVRIVASVLMLVPLGFVLGMPLALGLALSAADPPGYRALYWGVNGAASVCGSVIATVLSLVFGITACCGVGVLAYVMSTVAATRAFSSEETRLARRAAVTEAAA